MTASPFWTFSLDIYGKPGVPPACLTLQGESGVDVNVLLFGLFLASRGRALAAADFGRIDAAVAPWRAAAVVPLRQVRTFLKAPPAPFADAATEALRNRVKAVELEAERLQQEALFGLLGEAACGVPATADAATARRNVAAYADYLDRAFEAAAVETLIGAWRPAGPA
jgi:uncharacterized protein (TIGR02444 family)